MTQSRAWICVASLLVAAGIVVLPACHRGYYRRMADQEARLLVEEKIYDPRLTAATGQLDIDPSSRLFDPFSKDHPPIPPDDPQSHKLMNCVDGRSGYPHWHANGDTNYAENPEWMAWLPRNEKGVVVVDSRSAVEMAFINSSDYQRQREELYLSALDVSLERFGFDSQLFAGFNSFLETQGRFRGGGTSRTTLSGSLGATGGGINYRKLTTTGANFTVGLANSILWNFAGANTQTASSLINFSLVQPLLRNGGRDRIMESLTQVERTLLANVRQMERYQQGFYLQVITGRSPGQGPSRGGNFLAPPTASPTTASGLLGLLASQQQIRFAKFNVQQQQDVVDQFREFFARERLDKLQVSQAETSLYSSQANLLTQLTNYQNQLDRFKQTLGLPPWLNLELVDPFLDNFEFTGDALQERQFKINQLRKDIGFQLVDIGTIVPADRQITEAAGFQFSDQLDELVQALKPQLETALATTQEVLDRDQQEVEADLKLLEQERPKRVEYLLELRDRVRAGLVLAEVDDSLLDPDNIPQPDNLREQLKLSIQKVEQIQQQIEVLIGAVDGIAEKRAETSAPEFYDYLQDNLLIEIPRQLTQLSNYLIELSLTQAQARSNSISLAEINLDADTATAMARCLRLDWMNARASLVDRWRQIEFVGDQLESQFDLVLEGGVGNVGDNPFRIRYENGNLRGGFRFDTPLIRMSERNQYRQTLIQYQQARRSFYQFEDEASRNLRQLLRTVELNKILFELNRISVQVAISQVEASRLNLDKPAAFVQGGGARTGLGATTARDLTGAINNLQSAQGRFLDVWVDYEALRRNLDYDLGTFRLDENGHWIDPGTIDRDLAYRYVTEMGLDPTCLECELPMEQSRPTRSDSPRDQDSDPTDATGPVDFLPESNETAPPANNTPVDPTNPPLNGTLDTGMLRGNDFVPYSFDASTLRPQYEETPLSPTSGRPRPSSPSGETGTARETTPAIRRLLRR